MFIVDLLWLLTLTSTACFERISANTFMYENHIILALFVVILEVM